MLDSLASTWVLPTVLKAQAEPEVSAMAAVPVEAGKALAAEVEEGAAAEQFLAERVAGLAGAQEVDKEAARVAEVPSAAEAAAVFFVSR